MPRNGAATYVPPAGQPVVSGTIIDSAVFNALVADVGQTLTSSVATDGQTPMAANLPMGGNKLTGLAAGTQPTDSVRFDQVATAANLSGASGATLVGYGAKTVAQELDLLSDVYVIANDSQFGGIDPTGVTDSTVNMAAAMAYAATAKKKLVFRAGTYLVNPLRLSSTVPSGTTHAFDLINDLSIEGYGEVIFKVKNNCSTDASPKNFNMFYTDSAVNNISFDNIIFDGNWTQNLVSPNRAAHSYNFYNQSFICVFGNSANVHNARIWNCTFRNNAGTNNIICGGSSGVAVSTIGSDWDIRHCSHVDGGMDVGDFTAIFGYAQNVQVTHSVFKQSIAPTEFNGAGARNAFEVHMSNANFSDNIVQNYFNAVIVNSNWVNPVLNTTVCRNLCQNMFLGGVRLWRFANTPLDQTYINGVVIADNVIELNNTLYSTASTVKAGIWGNANYQMSMDNVSIRGNVVTTQSAMQSLSACVYLETAGTKNTNVMDNYDISNNISTGTYYGIYVRSLSGSATFGTVRIQNNQSLDLKTVGVNVSVAGVLLRGDNAIAQAIINGNYATTTANSGNGIFILNTIGRLHTSGNQAVGFASAYTESTPVIGFRSGESAPFVYPNILQAVPNSEYSSARKTIKLTVPYTALSTMVATTGNFTVVNIPAKRRLVSIIVDTTTGFTGGAIATLALTVGRSAGGGQFIASHSIMVANTKGLVDGDMGTELTRAAAVQGGAIASWTGATSIYLSFTATGDNLSSLTAGSLNLYFIVDSIG
jgi:hypothetical protein